MKYIRGIKGLLTVFAMVVFLGGMTTKAAEFSVTPTEGVLYTGKGAEVFVQPDPSTIAAVFPGDFPVQVTGITDNGYFQVNINGVTYYIYGKALSVSTGTQAYKLTSVDAKAALVGDADSGALIYAQNATDRLAPASTTKIMTALLVMDAIAAGQITLDTPVVVSPSALAGVPSDASHVKPRLKAGEVMNVLTLLQSVMMVSDCHACNVLAEAVAGSVDNFVVMMNARAAALGCTETNFVNTSGYPEDNHYSNAYSLFLITREAMKYPLFQSIIAQTEVTVPATNLSQERKLETTNALLTVDSGYYNPYAVGGKTGSASSSGLCFVSAARNSKKTVITVILGAATNMMSDGTRQKQQFAETNKLIEIGLAG
ncbi:MAG: D-alanyl-D-alanine carboxypeptidase [Lachnospiraceae bacterium]|nr:D-alanyl-D-alanine carboxypeptidase [Lachnospiraceae bacterium]